MPVVATKTTLGALYLDGLRTEDPMGVSTIVLNMVPDDGEVDVHIDKPVAFLAASLGNVAVTRIQVRLTSALGIFEPSLVYDSSGGFAPGYGGSCTFRPSPGAGLNDEAAVSITHPVFTSLDIITVEVGVTVSGT